MAETTCPKHGVALVQMEPDLVACPACWDDDAIMEDLFDQAIQASNADSASEEA